MFRGIPPHPNGIHVGGFSFYALNDNADAAPWRVIKSSEEIKSFVITCFVFAAIVEVENRMIKAARNCCMMVPGIDGVLFLSAKSFSAVCRRIKP